MAWIHYIKQIESKLGEQAKKVQKQKVVFSFKNLLFWKTKIDSRNTTNCKPEDNFTQNHIQTYQLKYSIATVQQTITIQIKPHQHPTHLYTRPVLQIKIQNSKTFLNGILIKKRWSRKVTPR